MYLNRSVVVCDPLRKSKAMAQLVSFKLAPTDVQQNDDTPADIGTNPLHSICWVGGIWQVLALLHRYGWTPSEPSSEPTFADLKRALTSVPASRVRDGIVERLPKPLLAAIDQIYDAHRPPSVALDGAFMTSPAVFKVAHVDAHTLVWYRGDISTLAADMIVTAGNEEGRGCFIPGHVCLDNILYAAGGPRIRIEIDGKLGVGGKLTVGAPGVVTGGYHLPSRKLLHVVGPTVTSDDGRPHRPQRPGPLHVLPEHRRGGARSRRRHVGGRSLHLDGRLWLPVVARGQGGHPRRLRQLAGRRAPVGAADGRVCRLRRRQHARPQAGGHGSRAVSVCQVICFRVNVFEYV
jgi:hypothetical protein